MFDFKKFLAAVPALDQKPCHVEQETANDPASDLADARAELRVSARARVLMRLIP